MLCKKFSKICEFVSSIPEYVLRKYKIELFGFSETLIEYILYWTKFTSFKYYSNETIPVVITFLFIKKKSAIYWPLEGVSSIFQVGACKAETRLLLIKVLIVTFRLIPLHVPVLSVSWLFEKNEKHGKLNHIIQSYEFNKTPETPKSWLKLP